MESLLIWLLAILLGLVLFIPYFIKFRRAQQQEVARHVEAVSLGMDRPSGQYPIIDVDTCIGCGGCVTACPESDVLGIVHGKATVVNGARCIGHAKCAEQCPVEAIQIGLGDIRERDDIPRLSDTNESTVAGVYVAGELSGFALISNAIKQGLKVIQAIAADPARSSDPELRDVIVVGAGPCGLTAALVAQEQHLSCMVLEQEEAGGTILQYPRRKLVLVQPVSIPLYGELAAAEYTKEELLEIWDNIIDRFQLDIRRGQRITGVTGERGEFLVQTTSGQYRARNVVLALGRRGTPRKLGVPGEDLSKVMYKLIDAETYRNKDLLVIGGGDSAVEAAIALSRQPGNKVTLSYRKPKLFRIKKKNEERLQPLLAEGRVRFLGNSQLTEISADSVELTVAGERQVVKNAYVFVFAGGVPPFGLLKEIGVAFGKESHDVKS